MERIKPVLVEDIIAGRVKKNDVIAYVYELQNQIELFKDSGNRYVYFINNKRFYVSYKDMLKSLKGGYLRVAEDKFTKVY